jgi:hypothetical protein
MRCNAGASSTLYALLHANRSVKVQVAVAICRSEASKWCFQEFVEMSQLEVAKETCSSF